MLIFISVSGRLLVPRLIQQGLYHGLRNLNFQLLRLALPPSLRLIVFKLDEDNGVRIVRVFEDDRFISVEVTDPFISQLVDNLSQERIVDCWRLAGFSVLLLWKWLRHLIPELLLRSPDVQRDLGLYFGREIVALELFNGLDDFPASDGRLFLGVASGAKRRVTAQPRRLDDKDIVTSGRLLDEQDRVRDSHRAMELSGMHKGFVSWSTPVPRSARESRYLDLSLSFSSSLVAYRAISPSLDEIATTGTSGEFEIDGESILLCYGEIGARLRGRCRCLPKGIGFPLCQGRPVRDDGTGEEERRGAGQTSVSSSGL